MPGCKNMRRLQNCVRRDGKKKGRKKDVGGIVDSSGIEKGKADAAPRGTKETEGGLGTIFPGS